MALLSEAQLDIYSSRMERHIASIVGPFGHIQKPPNQKGDNVLMEVNKIRRRNRTGQCSTTDAEDEVSQASIESVALNPPQEEEQSSHSDSSDNSEDEYLIEEGDAYSDDSDEENHQIDVNDFGGTDITDSSLFNIQMLHEANLKKVYEDAVDNPNFDIDAFCDYVYGCTYDIMELDESSTCTANLVMFLLIYLKKKCPEFLKLPRRKDLSEDWKFDSLKMLEANKNHVKQFFAKKPNMVLHTSYILIETDFQDSSEMYRNGDRIFDILNIIFRVIEDYFLDALDRKADKEEIVELEYKAVLEGFLNMRKQQLSDLGFSTGLVTELINREYSFFDTRAKLKTKPLPECYLLDKFDDITFFKLFRFEKIMVKYLAVVFNIPKSIITKTETPRLNAKNTIVKVDTYEDPATALAICLARLSSSSTLYHMAAVLGISPKVICNINKNVVIFINHSFSHLLNIDNCTYNSSYLQLLIDKSSIDLQGLKPFTTHMIDGTHTKISKPTKYKNSSYDATYDGKKQCDTVAFQFVTDCLGMFIDVTPATLGARHDRFIFTSSNIAKRLLKLKYNDIQLQVVGDSAYISGKSVYNKETQFFDSNDKSGWNIYGVPKRGDVRTLSARKSQKNISKVRCLIERSFGFRNALFKSLGSKDRQKLFLTPVSRENMTICIFTNIRQILYSSSCSQPISDVLPVDFYLLMWGALSDKAPLRATF